MKEKTDEELKEEFNITDEELKELKYYGKICIYSKGTNYDIFSDIKERELTKILTRSCYFYFKKGKRISEKEYKFILKEWRKGQDSLF